MNRFVGLTDAEQQFVLAHLLYSLLREYEQVSASSRELEATLKSATVLCAEQTQELRALLLTREVVTKDALGLPRASVLLEDSGPSAEDNAEPPSHDAGA